MIVFFEKNADDSSQFSGIQIIGFPDPLFPSDFLKVMSLCPLLLFARALIEPSERFSPAFSLRGWRKPDRLFCARIISPFFFLSLPQPLFDDCGVLVRAKCVVLEGFPSQQMIFHLFLRAPKDVLVSFYSRLSPPSFPRRRAQKKNTTADTLASQRPLPSWIWSMMIGQPPHCSSVTPKPISYSA